MAFRHGKNAVLKLDNSAGTLVDLSAYLDEISMPRSIETGETTTFGSTGSAKTYVTGLSDATISLGGKFDSTADAHFSGILTALLAGTIDSVSFEYGKEGSTAGRVKYSGEALLTSYEVSSPVADIVTFSAELQVTGAITRGTWS
jgi:predicted secreted protein